MRKLLAATAAVTLATLVALVLAEVAVRIAAPQNLSGTWLSHAPGGYWINRAHAKARHQYGERTAHVRINSLHLRGDEPADAEGKVLCLGDSFTFGWLLEENETFVHHLESSARRDLAPASIAFLNGGTGGWGAAHYTAFYERFGAALGANVVVVFLNFDDVVRSIRNGPFRWKDASRTAIEACGDDTGRDRLRDLMQSLPGYQWLLEHSHLVQLTRQTFLGNLRRTPPVQLGQAEIEDAVAFAEAVFRRLKTLCDERGAGLRVVCVGCGKEVNDQAPEYWSEADRAFEKRAPAFFASLDVPFTDLSERMATRMGAAYRDYFIAKDVHFNEKGARLFADVAWPWLREQLQHPGLFRKN